MLDAKMCAMESGGPGPDDTGPWRAQYGVTLYSKCRGQTLGGFKQEGYILQPL